MNSGFDVAAVEGGTVSLTTAQLTSLETRIAGNLLCAGDAGWDEAVRIWNAMAAKRPALVVQPITARDVAAVVDFAREHGLLLSVKGGGHNIAGTAIAEGGLMLDMSRMCDIVVDPGAMLARVGPGCRLGDVDRATQEHGLATPLGFISKTGVAGLTLGGGLGYLTRRFGWTVDNLEEVEIVTADGRIRRVSRHEDADLFWAVRGGGGNFGVATGLTFRLHNVGPAVYGGLIAWPFARADEVLRTYRLLTGGAPRELSVWLVLLHAPPAPFVPEQWRGQKICAMAVCYTGDLTRVDEVIAPIRVLGDPVVDLLGERQYVQIQSYLDDSEPDGMHYYWKTEYAAELGDGLLATLRDLFAECPIPGADLGLLHLEGALNERPWGDGAVGNRDVRFAVGIKGMWPPGEPREGEFREWVRAAWRRIQPYTAGRTYVNFQTADEEDDRVRGAYGANFGRLAEIKAKVDPANFFRSNRNIRPLAPSTPQPPHLSTR